MKTLTVCMPYAYDATHIQQLRSLLSAGIRFIEGEPVPPDIDILVDGKPQAKLLQTLPNLKALIIPYAGVAEETRTLMLQHPHIPVYNLHHNADAVAEYTLALLLAAVKKIVPLHNALRHNDWSPRYQPDSNGMLRGKTALILGYGAIGTAIARLLVPFGVEVLAIKRQLPENALDGPVRIFNMSDLHSLLPRTDFLIIALPLTPQTKGVIAAEELRLLSSNAFVVNVGRGELIDQHALYTTLKEKHIAGAALDVWYHYPSDEASRSHTPPADEPFGELENIVMSPHKAGGLSVEQVEEERMRALADLLNSLFQSDAFPAGIDLQAGY